jgi:hypothetical protein
MDFAPVSRAAAHFRMQITQSSGSRPRGPRTTAKALTEDDAAELPGVGSNELRLWLSLIAHNPGNLWRRLVLPKRADNCSLTSLQPPTLVATQPPGNGP